MRARESRTGRWTSNALFGSPTVALRGPWNPTDLVKIGPTADDLVGRYEYHLDFPGHALDPGCDYEKWSRRITEGTKPTVYAHVATDPAYPGQLALQYWLFYAFNDFNNLHEGDWEMIQLDFRARDAASALETAPVQVGYSSHEGAERADWGDDKLELVDRTHPVVYPSQGSHANKFTQALYVGSSAEAGVGCDNTQNANVRLRPVVETIPSDPSAARKAFPWIAFEGRWGELQPAFFNGPTGPNLKTQWTQPITWAQSWRTRSYAVPAGGVLGTGATDFFCRGVATVSRGLVSLLREPCLDDPRPRRDRRDPPLRRLPHDLASGCAAPSRAPTRLGPDAPRGRPHVPHATEALSRNRSHPHPSRRRDLHRAGTRARRVRAARHRHDR